MRWFDDFNANESISDDQYLFANNQKITEFSITDHLSLIIGGILTFCCILMNMLTVFVLIKHRPLQKSISNLYILSLSLSDILIGIFIMSIVFINNIKYKTFKQFFGHMIICKTWQILDFVLSTISLYSTCAIALDRVWNLEKPLRVFKRSRRIAKRLILCIWLLPVIIWVPIYYFVLNNNDNNNGCLMSKKRSFIIPIIAVPVLYIPAIILLAMFVRISLVVHQHLKFLKEHSNVQQFNSNSPLQEKTIISINSFNNNINNINNNNLKTYDNKKTYDSLTTVTSGYYTTTLKTPRSNSPWFQKSNEYQLAPLSEEKSSGRERSQSEQINLTPDQQNNLKITDSRSHSKIDSSPRKQSIINKQLLLIQRAEAFFKNNSCSESELKLGRPNSCRSRYSSTDSTSSITGAGKILRKFSSLSRNSSKRFSVIAIPSNLADLLQREGVSQQVKAAKAVALITICFLICWLPFLIVWPLKIYYDDLISDTLYKWCIWVNYACSTINPILYTLSSPRVRSALKSYFNISNYSFRLRMKATSFYKSNTVV